MTFRHRAEKVHRDHARDTLSQRAGKLVLDRGLPPVSGSGTVHPCLRPAFQPIDRVSRLVGPITGGIRGVKRRTSAVTPAAPAQYVENRVQTTTANMGEAIVFTSIVDAMSKGRHSCKGSFNAESGEEGNEDTKSYVVIFNAKWNSLAKALNNRMAAFFAAIYTVGNMTNEELKVEPGLSNTQEVVRCWRDILT